MPDQPKRPDPAVLQAEGAKIFAHCKTLDNFTIELAPAPAVMLIAQLQVALRHPQNRGPSTEVARAFIDQLIERIAAGDKTIESYLRRGDDPACDFPPTGIN